MRGDDVWREAKLYGNPFHNTFIMGERLKVLTPTDPRARIFFHSPRVRRPTVMRLVNNGQKGAIKRGQGIFAILRYRILVNFIDVVCV